MSIAAAIAATGFLFMLVAAVAAFNSHSFNEYNRRVVHKGAKVAGWIFFILAILSWGLAIWIKVWS